MKKQLLSMLLCGSLLAALTGCGEEHPRQQLQPEIPLARLLRHRSHHAMAGNDLYILSSSRAISFRLHLP